MKFLIALGITSIFSTGVWAQSTLKNTEYQERLDLHINSDLLITGETLFFKINCLQASNHQPSRLSSVAYVELIDQKGSSILKARISLEESVGFGDFFLPSNLVSSNYTLIAYTRWMKNFSYNDFYNKEIIILNPFKKPEQSMQPVKSGEILVTAGNDLPVRHHLDWHTEKTTYKPRKEIKLTVNGDSSRTSKLSISVRQLDNIGAFRQRRNISTRGISDTSHSSAKIILPDLRGVLISGKLSNKFTSLPEQHQLVYLTVPSVNYLFQICRTNADGDFYFNVAQVYASQDLLFTVDGNMDSLKFDLQDGFISDYGNFIPGPFAVDSALSHLILKRSVSAQIENAYFLAKKDSILNPPYYRFYGKADEIHVLDEYVRFPTQEDVLREFVRGVIVKKRGNNFTLRGMDGRSGLAFNDPPLILFDGIPVFDHNVVMEYDPLLIKKIEIVQKKFYYGSGDFSSIISFDTYLGTAKNLPIKSFKSSFSGMLPQKKYYAPDYENKKFAISRIPDYRVQLYWNPDIILNPGAKREFSLFSSDLTGEFEVIIMGRLSDGTPIEDKKIIIVEP